MSKTYIDKDRGRYENGIDEEPSSKLQRKYDRWNFEIGESRRVSKNRKSVKNIERECDDNEITSNLKRIKQRAKSKIAKLWVS